MQISVICWTRANNQELLLWFLKTLNEQTFTDFDVLIICDRHFNKKEEANFISYFESKNLKIFKNIKFYTHNNSSFNDKHSWWASYVRNFWILNATWKFIQLFDDDNRISPTYLEDELKIRKNLTKNDEKNEFIILPTILYRDSETIQNQWFSHFNYRQSRPVLNILHNEFWEVQMFSWNGIFWLKNSLKKVLYDEEIARICEDLDYTISLHEKWIKLLVYSCLKVKHYEKDKTKLEQARIWSYSQAKQKSRNRFLFVKKHWTKFDLFKFYFCWLIWCFIWLSTKAFIRWWKNRRQIIKGLLDWIKEWTKLIKKSK